MKKTEIPRKIAHLVLGLIIGFLVIYGIADKVSFGVFTVVSFAVFFIGARKKMQIVNFLIENFERDEVKEKFPGKGLLFYLLGCEICLILFQKDIAAASIFILAIGDSVPNFVGMYSKRIPFSDRKFLEGAIAGMILSTIVAMLVVKWHEALIASFIALFLEGIDMQVGLKRIDDNLIVPVGAGIVMTMMRLVFGRG